MAKYLAITKIFLTKFRAVQIEQVAMDLNSHADALASLASAFKGEVKQIIAMDSVSTPNIEINQLIILSNVQLGQSQMDPIEMFLLHAKLFEDKREVHKL